MSISMDTTPFAYFITFRCYATHLPGDPRGFVTRAQNLPGACQRPPHPGLHASSRAALVQPPQRLGPAERSRVDAAIREQCVHAGWTLHAINVRTNHVHVVVAGRDAPESATRSLREARLVASDVKPWARHGSTRWLWTPDAVEAACRYVVEGQGGVLPGAGAGER
jgi:REP element-mobilizing transposase RayT